MSTSRRVLQQQHLVARRLACDRQPRRRPGCATAEGVTSSRAGSESRDRGAGAAHLEVMLCPGESLVHIQESAATTTLGCPQVGLRYTTKAPPWLCYGGRSYELTRREREQWQRCSGNSLCGDAVPRRRTCPHPGECLHCSTRRPVDGPAKDNQGVALAVLPHTESRAHAQGARAVTGVPQQLTVRRC